MNLLRRHGLAILLGVAPLVFAGSSGEFENTPKMGVLHVGIALLALLRVADLKSRGRLVWKGVPLDFAVSAFYLLLWASLAVAINPRQGALAVLHWTAAVLFYVYVVTQKDDPADSIFPALAAAALAVSAIGICQHLVGLDWIPQAEPPAATFTNRNMAAHFIAICLPLTVGAACIVRSTWLRAFTAVSVLLSIVYLIFTRTRAAQLAMLVTGVILLLLLFFRLLLQWKIAKGPRRLAPAVAILLILVLFAGLAVSVSRIAMDVAAEASTDLRIVYWKNTLKMAADNPWGIGLGNFKLVYPRYHRAAAVDWSFDDRFSTTRVHNDHLQVLVELGTLGFVAWVSIFVAFCFLLVRVLVRGARAVRLRALAVGLGVLAFFIVACFSFPTERAIPPVYLFVFFGLVTRWYVASVPAGVRPITLAAVPMLRAALAVVLVLFLATSLYLVRGRVLADRHRNEGVALANAGRPGEAVERLRLAAGLVPGDADLPLLIAGVHMGLGDYDAALDDLEGVLRRDPHRLAALMHSGFCHAQLGRFDQAYEFFERALAIMPDYVTAHQNLGLIHSRRGEHDRAAASFESAIASALGRARFAARPLREDDVVPLRAQLGREHAAMGRYDEAADQFERVLAVRPDLEEVRRLLDDLRQRAGRSENPPD